MMEVRAIRGRLLMEVRAIREKAAGGDGAVLNRAGGARKIREAEEIADNFTEEDAAVLEKLEKNGAFTTLAGEGGVADNSTGEPGVESPVDGGQGYT